MHRSRLLRLITLLLFILTLSSCGYKPSSKYARDVLGNSISTSLTVSLEDPANSVIVKDAVDRAIIEVFHASLMDKRHAKTHLEIAISTPSYTPLQYDSQGFIISYRATITLSIKRISQFVQKNYTSTGTYDFSIEPNAVLTDQQRFDAIKFSSIKAIGAFVAQVSAEGSRQRLN